MVVQHLGSILKGEEVMFMIIREANGIKKGIGFIETDNLLEAKATFASRYGAEKPCDGLWVDNTYYAIRRKKMDKNVFKIDFDTPGYSSYFYPDIAIINLEEVLRLYLPDICFGRYQRRVNNFQTPEVKKELSYEFGDFDGQNWHRTSPDKGEFIGIYFGNRLCDSLWYDHVMPKLVKRFKRKIGKRKEEHFLIFKREKEVEKLSCLYR